MSRRPSLTSLSLLSIAVLAAMPATAAVQALAPSSTGPVIEGFGPVYDVPDPDFATPLDAEYRVAFEVASAPEDTTLVNPSIESLARFLNMHARAGVPVQRIHLALVLHGTAGKDALDNEAFRERYGHDNPNLPLLQALADAGVEIVLCGQTALHRGLPREQLAAPVATALSAMTALVAYQARGYTLLAF